MRLKVKDVNLSTGGRLIAILNEHDARKLDLKAGDRIRISRLRKQQEVIVVTNISSKGINIGEVGLFEEVLSNLGVAENQLVEVELAKDPHSLEYIRNRLDGKRINKEQMYEIVEDIIDHRLSETEITYFVAASYMKKLSLQETVSLTEAITNTGKVLKFKSKVVLDKHCIGGVPNNRTTMIVVPIIASLGYTIPKTSSRAITSPAGTADTMEVLAPVTLSEDKIMEVVEKTNACLVWGGAVNPAAADDHLTRIRQPLSQDPEGRLLASILAKKKAVSSTHVLIDIPYGEESKVRNHAEGKRLGEKFLQLGKQLGLKVKYLVTNGTQPIGNGVGPALEAKDVMAILNNDGPNDLRDKSVYLASEMLAMLKVKDAKKVAIQQLDSGAALEKMMEIIVAQGGRKHIRLPKGKFYEPIYAKKTGVVSSVSNKAIAKLSRFAGAPIDAAAGVYLRVHTGEKVYRGDELMTIYSQSKAKFENTLELLPELNVFKIK